MLKINPAQTVQLFGKITYESAGKALEKIMSLCHDKPEEEVFLIVNSGGGGIDAGFMFVDLVKTTGVRLVTIGTSHVGSMAIPVCCAGQRRLITPHTDFFFHEVNHTTEKEQSLSLTEIEAKSERLGILQKWYAEFVAAQTGDKLTEEKVLELMKNATRMFPDDILKYGLAHEII